MSLLYFIVISDIVIKSYFLSILEDNSHDGDIDVSCMVPKLED